MALIKRLNARQTIHLDTPTIDPAGKTNADRRGQSQDKYVCDWGRGCVGEMAVADYLTSIGRRVRTTHQTHALNAHGADLFVDDRPLHVKTASVIGGCRSWVFEATSASSSGWVVLCGHVDRVSLGTAIEVEILWLVHFSLCRDLWKPMMRSDLHTKRAVYEKDLAEKSCA